MRKLVAVMAVGLLGLTFLALMPSPANAELKTSITGNIRLNAIYSSVVAPAGGGSQEIAPTDLPFTKGPGKSRELDNSQFQLDARRTRLQAVVADEVGMVKLSAFFQGDFDTSDGNAKTSNGRHFRMRLAYAQAENGPWVMRAGQSRGILSEYGDNLFGGVAAVDMVDENGEWDQQQNRAPGVWLGYKMKVMDGDLLVGVAVEKSATALTNNATATTTACVTAAAGGAVTVTSVITSGSCPSGTTAFVVSSSSAVSSTVAVDQGSGETVPLFGAAGRFRTPLYAIFVRGAVQNNTIVYGSGTGGTPKQGSTTSLMGWVGAIGAEVTPGPLTIGAQYWRGEGLNRGNGTFNDVVMVGTSSLTPNMVRHIRPITTNNWHASVGYALTKNLKFNTSYEFLGAEPNRKLFNLASTSTDKEKFQAVHAGISYTFWTRFNFGLEYQWGKVDSFGSSSGIMNAVNSRLHFYF